MNLIERLKTMAETYRNQQKFGFHSRFSVEAVGKDNKVGRVFRCASGAIFHELSQEIDQFDDLIKLDLSYSRLSTLPPEIGQLTNLLELNLGSNGMLTTLPPELGRLTNLQELDLHYNSLRHLPPEIGQLTNLTTCTLNDNALESLPIEIGNLHKIKTLDLSGNRLTELPPEICQLTSLTALDLRSNSLTHLPSKITQLTNLTTLYIDHNPLPQEVLIAASKGILSLFDCLHDSAEKNDIASRHIPIINWQANRAGNQETPHKKLIFFSDQEATIEKLSNSFKRSPFEMTSVREVDTLLEKTDFTDVSAIVFDMAHMHARYVLDILNASNIQKSLPVLALSQRFCTRSDIDFALNKGVFRYLLQPINPIEVFVMFRRTLQEWDNREQESTHLG